MGRRILLTSVWCALALFPQVSGAQEPPVLTDLLKKEPQTTIKMTREQLKTCMLKAVEIAGFEAQLEEQGRVLQAENDKLSEVNKVLVTSRGSLDRTNKVSVDTFNARLKEVDGLVEKFNLSSEAHNVKVLEGRKKTHQFNMDCAGISYSKADEASLLKDLGLPANPMARIPG